MGIQQEEKTTILNQLFSTIYKSKTGDISNELPLILDSIVDNYGKEGLMDIFSSECNFSEYVIFGNVKILEYVVFHDLLVAEKILLQYGAPISDPGMMGIIAASGILYQIRKRKNTLFNPTLIYVSKNLEQQLLDINNYFTSMYEFFNTSSSTESPICKTFIITSAHWACCHCKFMRHNDQPILKIFFIDSLGDWDMNQDIYSTLLKIALNVFNQNIKAFISRQVLQRDAESCGVIALTIAKMLYSLECGKFKQQQPSYDLFEHLEQIALAEHAQPQTTLGYVISRLPAKLQQISQYAYNKDGDLALTSSESVNSKGVTLNCVLLSYRTFVNHKHGNRWHNLKLETKFKGMLHGFEIEMARNNRSPEWLEQAQVEFSTAKLTYAHN